MQRALLLLLFVLHSTLARKDKVQSIEQQRFLASRDEQRAEEFEHERARWFSTSTTRNTWIVCSLVAICFICVLVGLCSLLCRRKQRHVMHH